MSRSHRACVPQLVSLCPRARVPRLLRPCATSTDALPSRSRTITIILTLEHFHDPSKETPFPLAIPPCFCTTLCITNLLSVFIIDLFWTLHGHEIIQYVVFCDQLLLSLCKMLWKHVRYSFLLPNNTSLCGYTTFCFSNLVDTHFGHLHFCFAIVTL